MAAAGRISDRARGPSFIRAARRGQLVECAIEVIARDGLDKASTVVIAQEAGVSRGVLTHHFRDRADLIDEVVRTVYELGVREVEPAVVAAGSPREALLAFIGGSVDFYAAYPDHVAALGEIFGAAKHSDAPTRPQTAAHNQEMTDLRQFLLDGQRGGQFRDFDAGLMASTIRAALDAALVHLTQGGEVDHVRGELVRTLDAATRKEDV